jgi:hypothetical protein
MRHIEHAQKKLAAALRAQRAEEALLSLDTDVRAHALAREALVSALPSLSGLIEKRVGDADARIYSRQELREVLAEFAVDLMFVQMESVLHWLRAKAKEGR